MRTQWLAVVVALGACSSKREAPPPEVEVEIPQAALERQRAPRPTAQDVLDHRQTPAPPPAPPDPAPAAPPPTNCLLAGELVALEVGPTPRVCVDAGHDSVPDQCARWPAGGPPRIEPYAEQEHERAEPPDDPVTFHSDSEHNDDSRIDLTGGTVEICPYDRVCLKLMPRLDDGELPQVATDADYRRAAFVVRSSDGQQGAVELWDLERGRRYTRLPYRGLRRDEGYSFSIKLGPSALVALAERDQDHSITGAIYGLDGGYRGALGGGSLTLDGSHTLETAGLFAIVDPQTDDAPYVVHVVDLVAGGAAARFAIQREAGADSLDLQRIAPGVIAAVQWGKQLRVDVIDARRRAARVLRAPAC